MVTVKPKKSPSMLTIALIIGAVVCLFAVIAILVVNGGPHKQPNLLTLVIAGNVSSNDKISATTSVLRDRFNALGYDASVRQIIDNNGRAFIYVFYGDIPADRIAAIATTPGHVEMMIQTTGNKSEPVLSNGDIKSASKPENQGNANESAVYGVSIAMTPDGAAKFRQKCIGQNATGDPLNHTILVFLDDKPVCAVPLSSSLINRLASGPVDNLAVITGFGDEGLFAAEKLCASLAGGELPVPLKVAGT